MNQGVREAGDDARPRYPAIKAEIGEDPARYLAVCGPRDKLLQVRIRGIDRFETLGAWKGVLEDLVERGVVSEQDADLIQGMLQTRAEYLQQHGERPPADEIAHLAARRRKARREAEDSDDEDYWEDLAAKDPGELTVAQKQGLIQRGLYRQEQVATDGGQDGDPP